MPALVVANAAQMRLIWSRGGVLHALNVLGVVNSGSVAITQALTNTIGTAIKAAVTSSGFGAGISTTIALASVGLRDIRTANTPEFLDTGGATAGTEASDMLPPQTSLVVTLRTASAGRSFRGRVYLQGYTEARNVDGACTWVTESVAFIAAVKSALVTSGLDLGVLSRPRPTAPVPSAGFITPVTAIVGRDAVWDTQRRRAIPGI